MSWIVTLLKFRNDIQHVKDLESGEKNLPLGTKSEILALLKKWFPDANHHDPSWISGGLQAEFTEIIMPEVDELEDDGLIYSIGFRNPSWRLLRDVCTTMGWKAFDPSDGDFIDFASLPPEYFSEMFLRKHPQAGTRTLTDYIVHLRNQILEAGKANNINELRTLAHTLQTLEDFCIEWGDSTFWTVIDNLAYFAQHAEIADYTLYIPEEAAIRNLEQN
jgi:hypothetical protein